MKKWGWLIVIWWGCRVGLAQDSVSVQLLRLPSTLKIGDRCTITAEISSISPLTQRVWMSVTFPPHWQIIAKKLPNTIVGLYSARFTYTVSIGRMAQSGKQTVAINVFKEGWKSYTKNYFTKIEAVRHVTLEMIEPPAFAKVRDTLRTQFVVHNHGSETETLFLQSTYGLVEHHGGPLRLKPGASQKVALQQVIAAGNDEAFTVVNDLRVTSPDTTIRPLYKAATVPVYLSHTKPADPYRRFPIDATLSYNMARSQNRIGGGIQYNINGKGYLDTNQKHYVNASMSNSSQIANVVGLISSNSLAQYSFTYRYNDTYTLSMADYSLKFSKLIESSRFGRGVRFEQTKNKRSYSLFYLKTRLSTDIREVLGAQYVLTPRKGTKTTFHYLSKNMIFNKEAFWAHHLGISHDIKRENFEIEGEVAVNYARKKVDAGLYQKINYRRNNLYISNNLLYAGKHYFGFYNDSWQWSNGISYTFPNRMSASLSNSFSRANPSFDLSVTNVSPYSRSHAANLAVPISSKQRLIFSVGHQEREDRMPVKRFHFKEDFVRTTLSYQLQGTQFQIEGQAGYAHNLLVSSDVPRKLPSYRMSVQNNFVITPNLTVSFSGEVLKTAKYSTENTLQNSYFYGGALNYRMGDKLSLNVNYRNNLAPDELISRRDFFSLQAQVSLGNHRVLLSGGQSYIPGFTDQNNLTFSINYHYLFKLRLGKDKNFGSIRGQITGGSGVKKGGVLVEVGNQKFLTDTDGKFIINNLAPKRYKVNLVRSSMSMSDVPEHQGPLEVEIKADSTVSLQIPFVKAGAITGKINVDKKKLVGNDAANIPHPVILLKLYSGDNTMLTMPNDDGSFSFREVKPGDWTLEAKLMNAEGKYTIIQPQRTLTVAAEKETEVTYTVRAISRTVRFVDKPIQKTNPK